MPDDPVIDDTHIGPLHLDDAHGRWVFEPQANITALESILITTMWVKLLQHGRRLDWREYLTRDRGVRCSSTGDVDPRVPDLTRHFKPVD